MTRTHAAVARRLLFQDRQREIRRRTRLYETLLDRDAIERYQLESFNRVWRYCLEEIPFYRSWAAEHALPSEIRHVSELGAFPALTKQVLVEREAEVFRGGAVTDAYSTGGTTGTPTRYPRGHGDALYAYADVYAARLWWGLRPFDRYVHLWGHSHLFGGSVLSRTRRWLADKAVNAVRLNAYDLTEESIARHLAVILDRDPVYVVGYTSTIFRIARYVETQGLRPRLTRLRAVIITAETASDADVALITRVFGVPVVIEYGAAETGTLATSRGATWPLQVLWTGCVLRLDEDGDVLVTTINDRLFPLVNYAIGDRAEAEDVERGNALSLRRVLGRRQDVVRVRELGGRELELSSILPVHVLKLLPGITAVQFRQDDDRLTIFVTATHSLDLDEVARTFTRELRRDHPTFDESSVSFQQVAVPLLTRAGKHALFVE